jgi:hypothetical protein
MKPVMLVACAPLALAACNPANPFGGKSSTGNTTAAVPVTPDAVIVNGVTYVRAGAGDTIAPSAPSPSPTMSASSTIPPVAPAATPPAVPTDTPTPPSSNPDGVIVTGGH